MILFFNTKKLPAQSLENYESNLIKNKGIILSNKLLKYWNVQNNTFKEPTSKLLTNNLLEYSTIKKNKTTKILILLQLLLAQLKRISFLKLLFSKTSKFLKIWLEEKLTNELLIIKRFNEIIIPEIKNKTLKQIIKDNIILKIKKLKTLHIQKTNYIIKKLKTIYNSKTRAIKDSYKQTLKYYGLQYNIPFLRKFFMQLIKYPELINNFKYLKNFLNRKLFFRKAKKFMKTQTLQYSLKNKYPLLKSMVNKNADYTILHKKNKIIEKTSKTWLFLTKRYYNMSESKIINLIKEKSNLVHSTKWIDLFIILENETSNVFNLLNTTYELNIPEENIIVNDIEIDENGDMYVPKHIQISDIIYMAASFTLL